MTLACWQATIVNETGDIQASASVEVRLESTGALANIFSDRAGSTPLGNPFTVGSDGLARFFAVGGAYKITATKGSFSQQWRYVGVSLTQEVDQTTSGISFQYSTNTADSDPGSGFFKFNNASPASATIMYISLTAADVGGVTTWLDSWDDGGSTGNRGTLIISSATGSAMLLAFVTGSVTTATGYRKIALSVISATGGFNANDRLTVLFVPFGATGATGATSIGKHSIWVPATTMFAVSPSSSNLNVGGAVVPYLAFDPTTDEFAYFNVATPKSWNAGNWTAEFFWTHPATATNFGVSWGCGLASFADNVAIANVYVEQKVTDTGGTTSNMYRSAESGNIDPGNTQAKQDLILGFAHRGAVDAGDTLAVDAFLIGVMLHYTTDAATDA